MNAAAREPIGFVGVGNMGSAMALRALRQGRAVVDYDGPLREIATHESPKSQKHLHAAIDLAERLGVPLPIAALAHDEMPSVWGLESATPPHHKS